MWAVYVFTPILLLFLIILLSKLSATLIWNGALTLYVRILGIKFIIMGQPRKKARIKKKKKKSGSHTAKKKATEEKSEKLVSGISDIISLVREVIIDFSKKFLRYIKVDYYRFNITVATDDAAKTAVVYGAVSASVYSLTTALFEHKARRKNNRFFSASVIPDFSNDKSVADIEVRASIYVWQAIICLLAGGNGFLRYTRKKSLKSSADTTKINKTEKEKNHG